MGWGLALVVANRFNNAAPSFLVTFLTAKKVTKINFLTLI